MKKLLFFIIILSFLGCIKARDHLAVRKGALNMVLPFGEGGQSRNYLVVDGVVIDRTDTRSTVNKKLGEPSFIGTTIEGYKFHRYEDKNIEIYFDDNKVVDWTWIDFRP